MQAEKRDPFAGTRNSIAEQIKIGTSGKASSARRTSNGDMQPDGTGEGFVVSETPGTSHTNNEAVSLEHQQRGIGTRKIPGIRSASPAKRSASEVEEEDEAPRAMEAMELDPDRPDPKIPSTANMSPLRPLPGRPKSMTMEVEPQPPRTVETLTGDSTLATSEDTESSAHTTTVSTTSPLSSNTSSTSTSLEPLATQSAQQTGSQYSPKELEDQVEEIKRLTHELYANPKEGAKGFVISNKWLARVQSRTTQGLHEGYPKAVREGEIGPIDSSDVVLPMTEIDTKLRDSDGMLFIPLKPGLRMGEDLEVIPEEAWIKVVGWYEISPGSNNVINRYLHNTTPEGSSSDNFQFELYPTIFTVQKLRNKLIEDSADPESSENPSAVRLIASRSEKYQDFLRRMKVAANIDMKTKVQVHKVIETLQASTGRSAIPTPASSRSASPMPLLAPTREPLKFFVDVETFSNLTETEKLDYKDETDNEKYNGHLRLDMIGFPDTQTLILEEQVSGPAGGEFVSDNVRKAGPKSSFHTSKSGHLAISGQKPETASGRNSPSPAGILTRGRTRKDGRTKGCTGLTNLGNTCYMNSALQCIRSVEELAVYFLDEHYKSEINSDNPLGYHGAIAKAYAQFLVQIYGEPGLTSFAPRNFKSTLGRCQPLFSGYGQQDSQEFLSFLVDGLHEDLNKVLKKPYMENPESDDKTVHDPEAIRLLGEKFRQNFAARNNSIAMDLFNGFYKNTMVCPICDKVSITFDPYSLLTLQLPIENTWQATIWLVQLMHEPILVHIDIDKHSSFNMLKEYVAKKVPGLQAQRLMVAEMYQFRFYKFFEDSAVISESNIQPNDVIAIYELDDQPTNFPPKKKPKIFLSSDSDDDVPDFESPFADRMVIPLINRQPKSSGSRYGNRSFGLWPTLLLITREEAMSYELILRKVLAKIDTMTTHRLYGELTDSESDDLPVPSTDASEDISKAESRAPSDSQQAPSQPVEAEDDFVDVAMDDAMDDALPPPISRNRQVPVNPQPKHHLLDRNFKISLELEQLFEMCYYSGTKESVPTSFQSITESADYPTIASRMPYSASSTSSAGSFIDASQDPIDPASSEDELSRPEPTLQPTPQRSQSSNNSDDEMLSNAADTEPSFSFKKRTKPEHLRKERKHSEDSQTTVPQPLIRPGEGIVLDWTESGWDTCFGGGEDDDWRGEPTASSGSNSGMRTLLDPELEQKKARRSARKKSGVTLDECFSETAKSEILSEENAWYCGRCKELRRATKTLEVWTVPDILVLHLKRFSSTSRLRDKIDVLVDFPTEGLDLSGRVGLPDDKSLVYDLFAVDNHYGGLGGGHYTAYAQNFYDKKWYDYNDSSVSQISQSGVVTRAAYLLFYRRRADHPLGPPYLQKLTAAARAIESGEGQRLDDPASSHSGSSGALQAREAGAEVNRQLALVGEAGDQPVGVRARGAGGQGAARNLVTTAKRGLDPESQTSFGAFQDEGLGMDDDEEDVLPSYEATNYSIEGPIDYGPSHHPEWSFANLPNDSAQGATVPPGSNKSATSSTTLNDVDSDMPAAGSDVQDLANRMQEDFPRDDEELASDTSFGQPYRPVKLANDFGDNDRDASDILPLGHATPEDHDPDTELKAFGAGLQHVVGVERGPESEGEVAEVRIDDEGVE